MSVGAGVWGKLSGTSSVTDIVPAARIYSADSSPDNVYPLVAYKLEDQTERLVDVSPATKTWMLTVASVATDGRVAESLKIAIKAALDGAGWETWGSLSVQGCWFQSETFETAAQEDQLHRFYIYEQTYKLMTY